MNNAEIIKECIKIIQELSINDNYWQNVLNEYNNADGQQRQEMDDYLLDISSDIENIMSLKTAIIVSAYAM